MRCSDSCSLGRLVGSWVQRWQIHWRRPPDWSPCGTHARAPPFHSGHRIPTRAPRCPSHTHTYTTTTRVAAFDARKDHVMNTHPDASLPQCPVERVLHMGDIAARPRYTCRRRACTKQAHRAPHGTLAAIPHPTPSAISRLRTHTLAFTACWVDAVHEPPRLRHPPPTHTSHVSTAPENGGQTREPIAHARHDARCRVRNMRCAPLYATLATSISPPCLGRMSR